MRRLGRAASAAVVMAAVVVLGACVPRPSTPAAPAPAPAAPVAPVAAPATWRDQMLDSINANRAANGAAPLVRCATLDWAAQLHSQDQADTSKMSHTGSDGSSMSTRAVRAGYVGWTALAENVAAGYGSVDAVMNGWMNSSGHRTNLLNPTYTHVGMGQAVSASGTPYWTQDFGRSGAC